MIFPQYYTEAPAIMGGGLDKAREQAAQVNKYNAAEAHLILAQVAAKEKRYDEAESAVPQRYQGSAEILSRYWLQLADFYRLRGRFDDVQKTVLTAMAQPEPSAENYFDAANELYLSGRDFPEAVQYLQKYLDSADWWKMHRPSAPTTCWVRSTKRWGTVRPPRRNMRRHWLWRPVSTAPAKLSADCSSQMSSNRFTR